MSITAKTDGPNNLEYLDTDWKLATVYTAFLYPKSQQEAISLIYKASKKIGDKTLDDQRNPANWIINARKELMERGFLVRTDNNLKSSIIKAEIEPIVQSLIAAGVVGGQDHEIREGVRLVLNSDWFRNFFSDGFLNNPITYRNGTVYEPYREITKQNPSWSHLQITGLQNRLFQLLSEIGYYSQNIRWVLKNFDDIGFTSSMSNDPLLKELLSSRNFDSMLKNYGNLVPPRFIKTYYSCIENTHVEHIDDIYPERLFNELLNHYAGLFIPIQVSTLLDSCPYNSSVKRMTTAYFLKSFYNFWNRDKRNNPT